MCPNSSKSQFLLVDQAHDLFTIHVRTEWGSEKSMQDIWQQDNIHHNLNNQATTY